MPYSHGPHDIDRFFRGLTEHAFHTRLGVVDPLLVEYVGLLLTRFLRSDRIGSWPKRSSSLLESLSTQSVALLAEESEVVDPPMADAAETGREVFRDVGDAALFWSGIYPEAIDGAAVTVVSEQVALPADWGLIGKRAYLLASVCPPQRDEDDAELLERLSHEFDLCVEGLTEVRRMWGQ